MHRIDGPGATPGNLFTDGDPQAGVPATFVTDDWANAVQEELCNVVLASGLELAKPDNTQLNAAINARIAAAITALAVPSTIAAAIAALVQDGTFTPRLLIGGSAVGWTWTQQSGIFQRIGEWVRFHAFLQWTAKPAGVGAVTFELVGMPHVPQGSWQVLVSGQGLQDLGDRSTRGFILGSGVLGEIRLTGFEGDGEVMTGAKVSGAGLLHIQGQFRRVPP